MAKKQIATGTVHKIPADLRKRLGSDAQARVAWNDLTPLARNEFICWVISPKKMDTRSNHIKRTIEDLKAGKRRPCCWMGCVHRTDKPMNRSQKYVLSKRGNKS